MIATARKKGEFYLISAESSHRITFRNKDRLVAALRNHRVLTIRLTNKCSFLYLTRLVKLITVIADSFQKIIPCHFFHGVNGKHLQGMSF